MDSNTISISASVVSAIATVVAGGAAVASWKVASKIFGLEQAIENSKKPLIHIWCNRNYLENRAFFFFLSIINIGGSALPIRTMRILVREGDHEKTLEIQGFYRQGEKQVPIENSREPQTLTDIVLVPHQLLELRIKHESLRYRLEVMYYDNSFEFVEIDPSILGGNYVLTGKGKKYS